MVSNDQIDELLWQVSDLEGDDEPVRSPSDAQLLAYRVGELDEAEARRVESWLGRDRAARQRLIELAGFEAEAPPIAVRQRLLGRFEVRGSDAASRAEAKAKPETDGRSLPWRWAAAALFVIGLGAALYVAVDALRSSAVQPTEHSTQARASAEPLPESLRYRLEVKGIATRRGSESDEPDETAQSVVTALPETRLVFDLTPVAGAIAGLEVGLYRREHERFDALHERPGVERSMDRGAAHLTVRAGDLVGEESGVYRLWVVIARRGDLPTGDTLFSHDLEARLRADGRRIVLPATIELLTENESEKPERDRTETFNSEVEP